MIRTPVGCIQGVYIPNSKNLLPSRALRAYSESNTNGSTKYIGTTTEGYNVNMISKNGLPLINKVYNGSNCIWSATEQATAMSASNNFTLSVHNAIEEENIDAETS